MFVACYVLTVRLTGSQDFHFVPGYAVCMNVHLREFGKIVHYFLVVGLFLLFPLIVTVFSYRKVSKDIREHNMGVVQALQNNSRDVTAVSTHEIRLCRSLVVIVFAFNYAVLDTHVGHCHFGALPCHSQNATRYPVSSSMGSWVMGSIPVGDSECFFVPRSCHVD